MANSLTNTEYFESQIHGILLLDYGQNRYMTSFSIFHYLAQLHVPYGHANAVLSIIFIPNPLFHPKFYFTSFSASDTSPNLALTTLPFVNELRQAIVQQGAPISLTSTLKPTVHVTCHNKPLLHVLFRKAGGHVPDIMQVHAILKQPNYSLLVKEQCYADVS